jgi:hypothetical protein
VIAKLDWLRLATRGSPDQAREQTGQAQFHWGTPPPAADPSTKTRNVKRPLDRFDLDQTLAEA